MEQYMLILGITGTAAAALCGVCAAEALMLREVLKVFRENRKASLPPESPAADRLQAEEERLGSAAMQEGFDNLMRYTARAARGERGAS